MIVFFLSPVVLISTVNGWLDYSFKVFILEKYGANIVEQLDRPEQGAFMGSFGGDIGKPRTQRPIILVHGLKNNAGYLSDIRINLSNDSWEAAHILGTTWGNGDHGTFTMITEKLSCVNVKQIRLMINVVKAYYRSKIDIIAFSMGSPLTRKAILGGKCVDTGEDLGEPLTFDIEVFISVAGANHGSWICNMGLFFLPVCNFNTGLRCHSDFLEDINTPVGYEGSYRYNIISEGDLMIGMKNCCGEFSGAFNGSTEIRLGNLGHQDAQHGPDSLRAQLGIMKRHQLS